MSPTPGRASPITVFAILALALALAACSCASMPYATDCMKNPFATGCRGISAKRAAGAPTWSGTISDLMLKRRADQMRARELSSIIELLMDATNKLVVLSELDEEANEKLAQPAAGNYLGAASKGAASHRAGAGQREEASK